MGDSRDAKVVANRLQARSLTLPYVEQELALDLGLTRRDVLKIAGYGSLAAFLAACGSSTTGSTGITATGGTMSIGSYQSDPGSKAGLQAIADAFKGANGGTKVNINTVDHGTFQNQITSYLQGTPQDVFTWFSGHRMRFFADKGLATPIDDVWDAVKSNYTAGFAASVKGNDGHVYAVPTDYYPWAVFYRKDVWAAKGYTVPTNWDDFKALCEDEEGRSHPHCLRRQGWLAGAGHL